MCMYVRRLTTKTCIKINYDYTDEHVSGGVDNRWFNVLRDVPLRQSDMDNWSTEWW